MYAQGELQDSDLVWAPHMETWQKAGAVKDQFANAPPAPPVPSTPAAYSGPFDPLPMAQPYTTGRVDVDASFENGSFFARLGALIIDVIILLPTVGVIALLVILAIGMPTSQSGADTLNLLVNALSALITWLYFALQESGGHGATFGKRALGLSVTDLNGDAISFWRATARHFSKIISGLICGIGYFFPLFTQRKQALHDIIAGCMIVK
jgi:uncharacterized RDD family membrane protein YckC